MLKKIRVVFLLVLVTTALLLYTGCPAEPDTTPPVGCGNVFGDSTDTYLDPLELDIFYAISFTVAVAQDINTLTAKFDANAGNFNIGVYSEIAGEPGTLLAETGNQTKTAGWKSVSITTTSLTAGTTYWLVVISDTDGLLGETTTGSGIQNYNDVYTSTMTNFTGQFSALPLYEVNVYATLICP